MSMTSLFRFEAPDDGPRELVPVNNNFELHAVCHYVHDAHPFSLSGIFAGKASGATAGRPAKRSKVDANAEAQTYCG